MSAECHTWFMSPFSKIPWTSVLWLHHIELDLMAKVMSGLRSWPEAWFWDVIHMQALCSATFSLWENVSIFLKADPFSRSPFIIQKWLAEKNVKLVRSKLREDECPLKFVSQTVELTASCQLWAWGTACHCLWHAFYLSLVLPSHIDVITWLYFSYWQKKIKVVWVCFFSGSGPSPWLSQKGGYSSSHWGDSQPCPVLVQGERKTSIKWIGPHGGEQRPHLGLLVCSLSLAVSTLPADLYEHLLQGRLGFRLGKKAVIEFTNLAWV